MPGWDQWWTAALAIGAAFAGGAINALAGGGTILTFPTLLGLGLPPVSANVTNAVSLWPGSMGGTWGFRSEIEQARRRWLWLAVPSFVGGMLGAILLVNLPSKIFASIAPYLVLAATALIALDEPISKWVQANLGGEQSTRRWIVAMLVQFVVSIYGGYFGAGLGILVLTALSLVGVRDIHQANGLKNLFSVAIKGVAVLYFIATRSIVWSLAILMAIGAIAGGYTAAAWGHRMSQRTMRWLIILIGVGVTIVMLVQQAK